MRGQRDRHPTLPRATPGAGGSCVAYREGSAVFIYRAGLFLSEWHFHAPPGREVGAGRGEREGHGAAHPTGRGRRNGERGKSGKGNGSGRGSKATAGSGAERHGATYRGESGESSGERRVKSARESGGHSHPPGSGTRCPTRWPADPPPSPCLRPPTAPPAPPSLCYRPARCVPASARLRRRGGWCGRWTPGCPTWCRQCGRSRRLALPRPPPAEPSPCALPASRRRLRPLTAPPPPALPARRADVLARPPRQPWPRQPAAPALPQSPESLPVHAPSAEARRSAERVLACPSHTHSWGCGTDGRTLAGITWGCEAHHGSVRRSPCVGQTWGCGTGVRRAHLRYISGHRSPESVWLSP